ncbi:putative transcriptional regulatory protein [Xylariaceae sp. FL0255]|nr:putative transcriptional regulatory protein [Xylariaceae sp. FL0255]
MSADKVEANSNRQVATPGTPLQPRGLFRALRLASRKPKMGRENGNEDETRQQPLKRRKVAESCKRCRTKKQRCEGERPSCSSCIAKGLSCEYNDATVPVPTSTLAALEARLQQLEQQVQASTPSIAAEGGKRVLHPSSTTATGHELSSSTLANQLPPTQFRVETIVPSEAPQWNSPNREQLKTPSCRIEIDHSRNEGFTDASTQFMRDMTQIAELQSGSRKPMYSPTWDKIYSWPVETDLSSMVVPVRAIADEFLCSYQRSVYPLFPVLHMPVFLRCYDHLWDTDKPSDLRAPADEAIFHATLNIVLALGCIHNAKTAAPSKLQTAADFYRRARKIMPLDALDNPNLETVQLLLLTAMYLTYTKYLLRFRNVLALAIEVAKTIGLHNDSEGNSGNQLRREMARRAWHMCLTLERLGCFTSRRTTFTSSYTSVPLPAQIDDQYLLENGNGVQPLEKPSVIGAFVATIQIFGVFEQMVKLTYTSWTQPLQLHELTEVIRLSETLDQIERGLPSHLKYSSDIVPDTRDSIFKLQAEGVITRILCTRLILLRPNVLAAARHSLLSPSSQADASEHRTSLQTVLSTEVSTLCVQAALSTISTLHANLTVSEYRLVSTIAVHAVLMAATVIIAASLVSELGVNLEDGSLYGDALARAYQVLDGHIWQTDGARISKNQLIEFQEVANRENQRRCQERTCASNGASSRTNGGPRSVSAIENDVIDFDFDNPIWNLQWSGMATSSWNAGPYPFLGL